MPAPEPSEQLTDQSATPTPEPDYIPVAVRLGLVDPEPSEPVSDERPATLEEYEELSRMCDGLVHKFVVELIADLRQAQAENKQLRGFIGLGSRESPLGKALDECGRLRACIVELDAENKELGREQGEYENEQKEFRARIAELEAERKDAIDADNESRRKLTRDGLVMLCNWQANDIATLTRANRSFVDEQVELQARIAELEAANETLIRNEQRQEQQHADKIDTLTRERDEETARADGFSRGVEKLLKRVEKAEAERDAARRNLGVVTKDMGEALSKAEAERDRLREALESAATACERRVYGNVASEDLDSILLDIASEIRALDRAEKSEK